MLSSECLHRVLWERYLTIEPQERRCRKKQYQADYFHLVGPRPEYAICLLRKDTPLSAL